MTTDDDGRAVRQLRLNTRAAVRQSVARVVRDFDKAAHGTPAADVDRFKATIYALSVLLQFDKAADSDLLAERLQAIEARLDAVGR